VTGRAPARVSPFGDDLSMELMALTPTIGAEVRGLDLRGELSTADHRQLRAALVRHGVHLVTGQEALSPVYRSFTTAIVDLHPAENRAVLSMLFDHVGSHRSCVRHRWSANDVARWDNRSVQHLALWDYWPEERLGHRVTVTGTRPETFGPRG
jgi:alpha-ketoglutarate-dependent taurine dioxygenase